MFYYDFMKRELLMGHFGKHTCWLSLWVFDVKIATTLMSLLYKAAARSHLAFLNPKTATPSPSTSKAH